MATKVAVVTGSNKGIGFAIVRGLCKKFNGDVYLTARDIDRGHKAVADLEKEGLKPKFHQLDVTDKQSVEKLRDFIKEKYGGIDVLVNNAAIAFKQNATEPAAVQAEETLKVNYFALVSTCEILLPIIRDGGRVVNVSSSAGHLSRIPSVNLRNQFKDPALTVSNLSELMKSYVEATKLGRQANDWGNSSYVVSKVGVSALSRIHQRMLESRNVQVNSVHPGYVDTDMTSHKGPLTIDQGAYAPLYLALDAPDSVKGQYLWHDAKIVDWEASEAPGAY